MTIIKDGCTVALCTAVTIPKSKPRKQLMSFSHPRPSAREQTGFTLVEVMIAMVVIAVGFLAMSMLQITSVNKNAGSSIRTESTTWATSKIEEIMSWSYSDSRLTDNQPAGTAEGTSSSPDTLYTIQYFVTDNLPMANTKTIDIKVTWTREGATRTTDFSSVIPKK